MTDEFDILKLVTERLDAAGIAHMLTGSVAAGYYAEPRMTRDVDLVVELDAAAAARVANLFAPDFLLDAGTIAAAVRRRGMFNLIHIVAAVKIDMIVRKDSPYRREEFRRRRRVAIGGHEMWLVSPEDLILSKLDWSKDSRSELQQRDVRGLLRHAAALDHAYMERWADELGIRHLLREAKQG
ncbi:MAG: hypothetical protein ABUS56_07465 [Acidobacteriota bacterium]